MLVLLMVFLNAGGLPRDVFFFQFDDVSFRAFLSQQRLSFGAVAEWPHIGVLGNRNDAGGVLLTDNADGRAPAGGSGEDPNQDR